MLMSCPHQNYPLLYTAFGFPDEKVIWTSTQISWLISAEGCTDGQTLLDCPVSRLFFLQEKIRKKKDTSHLYTSTQILLIIIVTLVLMLGCPVQISARVLLIFTVVQSFLANVRIESWNRPVSLLLLLLLLLLPPSFYNSPYMIADLTRRRINSEIDKNLQTSSSRDLLGCDAV